MVQQVKDLALPQLWLRVNPWPIPFHIPQVWPEKKKKTNHELSRHSLKMDMIGVRSRLGSVVNEPD